MELCGLPIESELEPVMKANIISHFGYSALLLMSFFVRIVNPLCFDNFIRQCVAAHNT